MRNRYIKPCPFCGGAASLKWKHGWWSVQCTECTCSIGDDLPDFYDSDKAIDIWNSRSLFKRCFQNIPTIIPSPPPLAKSILSC